MIDTMKARANILAAAREMASAYPDMDYCSARFQFGLLGKVKRITGDVMPTAKQCWEYVGLERSAIVDEFEFSQADIARSRALPST